MNQEKEFDKYKKLGSMHWQEMTSRDPRFFNAYQQARYDWILRVARDIRGKKVLDLGCGDGSLTYLLAKNGAIDYSDGDFFIGKARAGVSADPFDGLIDEVGIWSRAIDSTEVTSLYNGGAGLQYPFTTDNAITGSGTTNRIAKFTGENTIGDSLFFDDGTNVVLASGKLGIGTSSPTEALEVSGNLFANSLKVLAGGLGLDTFTSGLLSIGSTTANSINIGRLWATTTIATLVTTKQSTSDNCNSTASPATCGSAAAGSVAMATGGSTLVVNTTAVTANSQIFVMEDQSLGTRLGITCNTGTGRNYVISARTSGASFTIKSSNNPVTNKACLSYWIVN